MKKILFILAIIGIISSINTVQANHISGGEITWRCLGNGQYQFYIEIYRKCDATTLNFNNQTIQVKSGPISSITVKPDSNKWLLRNMGNLSPKGFNGYQFNCNPPNPHHEAYQFYPFKSDPITLNGIPPANGWEFSWSNCCHAWYDNTADTISKFIHLKSIMYPYKNQNTAPCFDSSPRFMNRPITSLIMGSKYTMSNYASDSDLDSMVFEFDDVSSTNNTVLTWKNGYSKGSPFPGSNQDPSNVNAFMDPLSGLASGLINSPNGFNAYTYSVRVDAYRESIKIASIWRNMVVHTIPKDTLNTGVENDLPYFTFDSIPTDTYTIFATVGDTISVNVQTIDSNMVYDDPNDTSTLRYQDVRLSPIGFLFSNDFNDNNDCAIPGVEPCATLNPPPQYNVFTGEMSLDGNHILSTIFNWQPNCKHIPIGENHAIHSFVFSALDDNSPPRESFAVLNVKLKHKNVLFSINSNQLTVSHSSNYYAWYFNGNYIPNSDSSTITLQGPGTYKVETDDCIYSYYYNPVGLSTNTLAENISIFPNPSQDQYHIALGNLEHSKLELKLMDMSGKEIQVKSNISQNRIQLDASHLKSGIYFLNISTKDEQSNFKLVKL